MMHSELIEWHICRPAKLTGWIKHSEGAQSTFGLSRARKILKELQRDSKAWEIRHMSTFEQAPKESDDVKPDG